MSTDRSPFMLTPWVRRLLMCMAAVYLLQLTVFTHPWLVETFGFVPSDILRRPWTIVSYSLLHGSTLHILGNALGLFMFGGPVEQRMGSKRFIRLYVAAVMGGAALSLAMLPIAGDALIIGASAGVLGVLLAFVLEWPDAPVMIFPLPMPVKAKWLAVFYVVMSLVSVGFNFSDGVAHGAHLGGMLAAFIYLRGSALVQRPRAGRTVERAPAVLVRPTSSGTHESLPPQPRRSNPDAAVREEVDRVLDKISQRGLQSLTPDERRFLDEMSKRFKKGH